MPRLTDLTGQNITTQATATYAENISAGENVKLNSSGELAKWGIGEFESSLTVGQVKSSFDGTAFEYQVTAYAKNRSLLFIASRDNNNGRIVVVERFSLSETITRNEFNVGSSLGGNIGGTIDSMVFLENANRLLVVSGSQTYAYSYANNTLTFDQNIPSGGSNFGPRQGFVVKNIQGDDIGCFQDANLGILRAVGYVNGTLSANSITAVSGATGGIAAGGWDPTNNKGLACFLKETGDVFEAVTFTVSGVTISTAGINDTEIIDWNDNAFSLAFDPVSSTFLVAGQGSAGNNIRYTTVDCSGANPVIATEADLAVTAIRPFSSNGHQLVYDSINSKFLLASQRPFATNESYVLTLTSGVLSVDNTTEFTTVVTSSDAYTNLFYDESYQSIVLVFREPVSGYEWNMAIGRLDGSNELRDFTPDQDNLLGVAIDTKTTGQTGKYRLLDKYKGVLVKNLSGLIPGQEYYVNSVGGLTTTTTSDFYGLAISATQAITSTVVGLLTELKKLTIGEGRTIAQFTGSDNTASGTYTTILDVGGSGVLKTITTEISNSNANPVYRITINGNNETLGGGNANPFKPGNTGLNITETLMIPYNGGLKIELDSSSASYTAWSTIILHQD